MGIPSPPPGERKALSNYTLKPVSFVSAARWDGGAGGSTHPGTPGGTHGCRAVGLVPCAHTLRAALGARGSWAQTRSAAVMEAAGADGPRGPSGVSPVHPRLLPAQLRSLLPARPPAAGLSAADSRTEATRKISAASRSNDSRAETEKLNLKIIAFHRKE